MAERKRSIWTRLYNGETSIDFVGRRRLWAILSGAVIAAGLVSLVAQGLNFGIDFEGGTAWEVEAPGVSVTEARDALEPVGLADAKVQILGGDTVRVQAELEDNPEDRDDVTNRLAELAGVGPEQVSVNEVGPTWGEEITNKARRALVFFLLAITLYVTLRFEWKMAIATLVALFHDILVTVGVYSLSGFEVTPATVIALLTILGYSIYDGIVVFDKIEENTKGLASSGRMTYGDMVDLSLNQVLMRSLNTSITALLPILSLLVVGGRLLGAATLEDFALALLVGLAASAYSSIFIASPLLALLKEREPRYASIKARVLARGSAPPLTPAAAAAGGVTPSVGTATASDRSGGGVAAAAPRVAARPAANRP
ncbi:MAG TPA: protein translocase subunit SecF, partial [Acidimicrobiales bacterium]|nr:protein translocase subunit SecF [Acidimicrobiales bacterium]